MKVVTVGMFIKHYYRNVCKCAEIFEFVNFRTILVRVVVEVIQEKLYSTYSEKQYGDHEELEDDVVELNFLVVIDKVRSGQYSVLPSQSNPEEGEPNKSGLWLNISHFSLQLLEFIGDKQISPSCDLLGFNVW